MSGYALRANPTLYYFSCNELDGFYGFVRGAFPVARRAPYNAPRTAQPVVAEHSGGTPSRAAGCCTRPWAKSP